MKKLILLTGFLSLVFSEGTTQKDIYLDYTNKVINYIFNIDDIEKVKSPFYEPQKFIPGVRVGKKNVRIKKSVNITLLSIFEDRAYIKVEEYLGEQLVSVKKKWLKLNDEIYDCKLTKLTDTDAVFKCTDRTLYKTINQKIPMLRNK
jgi:hypothetical protein